MRRLLAGLILLAAPFSSSAQSFAAGVQVGQLIGSEISEASGIVASRQNPNVLWTHNDSAFGGSVFAISTNGTPLGRWFAPTVFFGNFEDIAIGPGPNPAHHYIYMGDIGDNFTNRNSIRVVRFPEPAVHPHYSNAPPVLPLPGVQEIEMVYPDGKFDAEALLVDPLTGDLFITTKQTNSARLYRATRAELDGGGPVELTFIREMVFSGFRSVGAADISQDGRLILMRRNGRAWTWNRNPAQSVGDTLAASGTTQPTAANEVNGEAIGLHATGLGYYTTAEGFQPPLNYFRRTDGGVPAQPVVFVAPGSDWRYYDEEFDLGTAWRGTNYDDSAWLEGPAPLGYGQGDERTVISFGFDDFEKNVTTYFRRSFTRPSAVTNLALGLCFTDGAVVYLNGTEIFRRHLPTNAAFNTLATGSNRERQDFWTRVAVSPSLLRAGTNTLAVELHREERWQTDLSFDLQLVQASVEPSVRFTSAPQLNAGSWRINLAGPVGALARIEGSSDLLNWSPVTQVVLLNGTGRFEEAVAPGAAPRFFRLRLE